MMVAAQMGEFDIPNVASCSAGTLPAKAQSNRFPIIDITDRQNP